MTRRPIHAAVLCAALLALVRPGAAAPPPDPLAGVWTGTAEDHSPGGAALSYQVELRFSPPDGSGRRDGDLVARTSVTTQDGVSRAVTVRGRFRSADPSGRKFQAPDVTVHVESAGAAQSIGALWLLIDEVEGNRLTGRLGNDTDGWSDLALTRQALQDRSPSPPLGLQPAVYPLISTLSGVGELRAPEWVREGVRVSFWTGSAIISHDAFRSTLTEDPNGGLTDPKTGKRYSESTLPGGSGAVGFTQIDIVAAAPDAVVMQVSNFLHDGTMQQPALIGSSQAICHPSGCEYWIHPRALRQLASMGGFVFTGRRQVNGAVREVVVVKNGNGHSVYDMESGLLVSFSMRTSSSQPVMYFDPARKTGTTGSRSGTSLIVNQLRGVRETYRGGLASMDLPPLVDRLKGIEAQSVQTFEMDAGGGPQRTPGALKVEPVRRSGNRLVSRVTVSGPGVPAQSVLRVSSPVEEGSTFLPLAFLEGLVEGQVLDEDPVTGYSTRVSYVGPSQDGRTVVVITRGGATESSSFVYDRQAGMMIALDKVERAVGTTTRLQVEVVRTW